MCPLRRFILQFSYYHFTFPTSEQGFSWVGALLGHFLFSEEIIFFQRLNPSTKDGCGEGAW